MSKTLIGDVWQLGRAVTQRLGLWGPGADFAPAIRDCCDKLELPAPDVNMRDHSATFFLPHPMSGYVGYVSLTEAEHINVVVRTKALWRGKPPAVVQGLVAEADRLCPMASLVLYTGSEGETHVYAQGSLPSLDDLTPERFGAVLSAVAKSIKIVDEIIAEKGYA